jgi:hypothetical protein
MITKNNINQNLSRCARQKFTIDNVQWTIKGAAHGYYIMGAGIPPEIVNFQLLIVNSTNPNLSNSLIAILSLKLSYFRGVF